MSTVAQIPAQPATAPEAPEPRVTTAPAATETPATDAPLVLDDLLVEDVSIDGMCGVY
jgi:mycofactocin precursor